MYIYFCMYIYIYIYIYILEPAEKQRYLHPDSSITITSFCVGKPELGDMWGPVCCVEYKEMY